MLRSGLFGPWDKPEVIEKLDELPPGVNPKQVPQWGIDSWHFFPNFMLLIWEPGWFLTYHYWPTAVDKHIFECTLYFVPPSNARERLAQELAAVTFKEYALQDANTLEATQTMIGTKVVKDFPLCDQEILLRHLHKVTGDYVKEYRHNGHGQVSCPPNSPTWSRIWSGIWPPNPSATPSGWPRRWPRCRRSTTSRSPA